MSSPVLPARAGMSPRIVTPVTGQSCAPRTGGDEPRWYVSILVKLSCSPHGRG